MRMGYLRENCFSDKKPEPTAFDDFVVNFIVAFSGTLLLVLSDFM